MRGEEGEVREERRAQYQRRSKRKERSEGGGQLRSVLLSCIHMSSCIFTILEGRKKNWDSNFFFLFHLRWIALGHRDGDGEVQQDATASFFVFYRFATPVNSFFIFRLLSSSLRVFWRSTAE